MIGKQKILFKSVTANTCAKRLHMVSANFGSALVNRHGSEQNSDFLLFNSASFALAIAATL